MNSLIYLDDQTQPEATILVVEGGNNADIFGYAELCQATVVIVLDSANELRRLRTSSMPANARVFCLAQGHTARTLAERASEPLQRCVAAAAGMNADCGLGQVRGIGYMATQQLLESPEMRAFLDHELVDHLIRQSGGVLNHVRIIGKGSVAGGTASAGLPLFMAAVEKAVLSQTNATVHSAFHITGSISYTGLGGRVHMNAAVGTVEILASDTSPCQPNRAIRSVRLSELPPVGEDRAERSRFMLEVEQATQSAEVSKTLDSLDANASQDGPLGNVKILRSAHFTPLDARFDVARDIAPEYARQLRQVITCSNSQPSLLNQLTLNTRRQPLPREDLDGILSRVETADANELINAVVRPEANVSITVDASLISGETLSLSAAPTVWATSPTTITETSERLVLQNTCLQVLDQEISALARRLVAAEQQTGVLARQITRRIAAGQRPGSGRRLRQLFTASEPLADQIAPCASQLRHVVDVGQQYRSELEALRAAQVRVQAERDFTVSQLTAMATHLESVIPRRQQHRTQPTVVARPIDSIYPELWASTTDPDDGMITRLLLRAVDHVTEHGLATITSAHPPRLETVARQIAHHRTTLTPPWGGRVGHRKAHVVHVLPPVTRETADKLKSLIATLAPGVPVVVADRMTASINCTTLFFTPVTNLENDIFTQFIRFNLKAAYDNPNRAILFPSGLSALDELGITIGEELTFHKNTQSGDHPQ